MNRLDRLVWIDLETTVVDMQFGTTVSCYWRYIKVSDPLVRYPYNLWEMWL